MTIIDDLLDVARERHFGHETSNATERTLCRISRIPLEWCQGCRKGLHKHTRQPLIGSEPEEFYTVEQIAKAFDTPAAELQRYADARSSTIAELEQSLKDGVDEAREVP